MIYDLGTPGQWFVIWVVVWFISAIGWEILYAIYMPWERRSLGEPPPIIGGLATSILSTLLLAGIFAAIHGLTWMWLYG